MPESIFGSTLSELSRIAAEAGLPTFAAKQLSDWLYRKNAVSFQDMLNIPLRSRQWLSERYSIDAPGPVKATESQDGTRKYLFPAKQGGFVEAAWIPEGKRATLCLSVQVGCKMGCLFCMTGKQGFQSNLSPGEILNQYRSLPERDTVTNIVYMGMGEPMDNLLNVLASLDVLCSSDGYGLSPSRVTVSTVGLIPAMKEFLERSRCHLAVSMHSPFEEERRRLMPVENVYPLKEVLSVLRERPLARQRRVSFEYVMFRGVNDSDRHAREVAKILNGIRCRVNLIPFHPIPGTPLAPAPRETIEHFQQELKRRGILTTIRQSRGLDISAACGMLSTRELVRLEEEQD